MRSEVVERAAPALQAPGGYLAAVHARWLGEQDAPGSREIDGSLLLADVSGFTSLSERLARRGPIGAEELTEIVNTVFEGMLGDLHARGGDVLTFGGDAMCTLFSGPGHAARAVAAAWRIQEGMRPFRRLRTDAGIVALRVSAGIASGPVHLFVAGADHRALVVAGPVASEMCGLEALAQAGEVVCSPRTAAQLEPECLGEPRIGGAVRGVVLRRPPQAAVAHAPPPAGPPPLRALPPHLRDHVPGDGEHRLVTIGFLQFRGSDAVVARDGPGVLGRALDELMCATQDACAAHGVTIVGTDVDRDAGKIILVAGAPQASDVDEDRMLHALRDVVGRDLALRVRAGVHRGRAFFGDVGTEERRTWTLMGDATNTAARVMSHAAEATVLATTAVLDHTRDEFTLERVPPFSVKGKSAPLHAAVVGAPRGVRARGRSGGGRLIGRDRELEVLRGAVASTARGQGASVELVGEPGMGKSRLVEAALDEARGFRVVAVEVGPYGSFSPYLAVRPALRELVGAAPDAAEEDAAVALRDAVARLAPGLTQWLPLIGVPFGVRLPETPETAALSPEFARARLHAATAQLLDGLLGADPAVLLVEDAHWLDEASADLLGYLVRHLRGGRRMVLLTRRPADTRLTLSSLPTATVLEIGPLDPGEARLLVLDGGEEGAALSRDAAAELVARSGGNPLFLQELLSAVREGGDVSALPDSIEGLIGARIDLLPREDRAVLREAAVLGVLVPTALLEGMVDAGPFAARQAIRRLREFLVDDGPGRLRFRHALLREAAYAALPYRRRRELHARAADLLRTGGAHGGGVEEEHELIAIHEYAAHRWDRAYVSSRAAGQVALDRAAPVEAMAFFRRALESARHLGTAVEDVERAAVAAELAHAAQRGGDNDAAVAALRQARRLAAGEPLLLAEYHRREGRLRERTRRYSSALAWYTRGRRLIDGIEAHEAERLHTRLTVARAACLLRQGRLRAAVAELRDGVAGAQRTGDEATLAHAYYLLDWALTDLGSPEVHEVRGLALEIYERLGDREGMAGALNNLGIDAYYEGRWDEAIAYYERSRLENSAVGDVVQVATLDNNIAEVRLDQGRLDEAEALLREAGEEWGEASYALGVGIVQSNLGMTALQRGHLRRAAVLFTRARECFEEIGAKAELSVVRAREALLLLCRGQAAEALALVGDIRAQATDLGASPTLLAALQRHAAVAKAQLGDREGAIVRLREALEFAASIGADQLRAECLQLLVRLGADDAEAHDAEAAAVMRRLGIVTSLAVPIG